LGFAPYDPFEATRRVEITYPTGEFFSMGDTAPVGEQHEETSFINRIVEMSRRAFRLCEFDGFTHAPAVRIWAENEQVIPGKVCKLRDIYASRARPNLLGNNVRDSSITPATDAGQEQNSCQ
jgi:hypothetical protein